MVDYFHNRPANLVDCVKIVLRIYVDTRSIIFIYLFIYFILFIYLFIIHS